MVNYIPLQGRSGKLFASPFDLALDPNNRWLKLANLMPHEAMGWGPCC